MEKLSAELLPSHYDIDYAGESRQLRQEGNTLVGVLGISLAFVFVALAVQFNSFRDPLVVLLGSAPLALSSALLFTYLDLTTINTYTQIGLITLVGPDLQECHPDRGVRPQAAACRGDQVRGDQERGRGSAAAGTG